MKHDNTCLCPDVHGPTLLHGTNATPSGLSLVQFAHADFVEHLKTVSCATEYRLGGLGDRAFVWTFAQVRQSPSMSERSMVAGMCPSLRWHVPRRHIGFKCVRRRHSLWPTPTVGGSPDAFVECSRTGLARPVRRDIRRR